MEGTGRAALPGGTVRRGAARTPGAFSGQGTPEGREASLVLLLRSGPPGRESLGLEPKLGARGQGWGPEPAGERRSEPGHPLSLGAADRVRA